MIRARAGRLGLFLAVALATATACAAGGAGRLTITDPVDGATLNAKSIVVRGTAPAGSRITRNIPMAPDAHATADGDGRWAMAVDLNEGSNELDFRLGDDHATARTLHVIYDPRASAVASPSGDERGGAWDEPDTTVEPTVTPVPSVAPTSPIHVAEPNFELAGEATADGQPFHVTLGMDGGDYALRWTAKEPFDPAAGYCGVTIHLYDAAGAEPGGAKGVSTQVNRPTTGQVDYENLPEGEYELFVYAGCPWWLSLGRP